MGQLLEEFALSLRNYMTTRASHWFPDDPGAGDTRRRTLRLNRSALADVTRIDRNTLGRILTGKQPPTAFQIDRLLSVAGASDEERADWQARWVAAGGDDVSAIASPSTPMSNLVVDDYEVDGLFMVNTWGMSAPLTPEHAPVRQTGEIDVQNLSARLRSSWDSIRAPSGEVCLVSRIGELDWHETEDQVNYDIEVLRAPYSLALAQKELLADPIVYGRAAELLRSYDLEAFISEFPGCKIAVNVQVATSDGFLVALRRSRLVHQYKSQWALSINEFMQAARTPLDQEDIFGLSYRGIYEELGLEREAVESLSVEWFGMCLDCVNFYVFVNACIAVDCRELPASLARAHSRREHDAMAFLDRAESHSMNFRGAGPDGVNFWLHHAPLAAALGIRC